MSEETKTNLEMVEDFCNHFCVVCQKRIAVLCGTPVIHIGGCCSGVIDEENKVLYVREVKAHYGCYLKATHPKEQKRLKEPLVKQKWDIEDVKRVLRKDLTMD